MNYEDKDLTTAIDLKTRKTVAKWQSSCGADGPHGLSVDQDTGYLFVACSTQAEVLDAGHTGKKLSSINTGDGVDDLNYSPATHTLWATGATILDSLRGNIDLALAVVLLVCTTLGTQLSLLLTRRYSGSKARQGFAFAAYLVVLLLIMKFGTLIGVIGALRF